MGARRPRKGGELVSSAERSPEEARAALTREEFSAVFDRAFGRIYAHVSRQVRLRESCERIVRDVLTAHLDLLVNGESEAHQFSRLAAASDRLIGSEPARLRNESPTSPADTGEGTGETTCRE